MKSHCGDKTVVRSSYLHNGISYTGKISSLYWIRAQAISTGNLHPVSSISGRFIKHILTRCHLYKKKTFSLKQIFHWVSCVTVYWNWNVNIWMKFSSLATLKVNAFQCSQQWKFRRHDDNSISAFVLTSMTMTSLRSLPHQSMHISPILIWDTDVI